MTMSQDKEEFYSRREFLRVGATIATGIAVPPLLTNCSDGSSSSSSLETFVQPQVIQSVGGILDITLTAQYLNTLVGSTANGSAISTPSSTSNVNLRAFAVGNSAATICGPTLILNVGDRLRIKLVNRLPANPTPIASNPVFLGYPNNTNMHTHGFHVWPGILDAAIPLYGDYVMDHTGEGVTPGGPDRQYQYDIRSDHPAGPFWYHPHFHGSSAMQLGSFMAGAIMIRGPVDAVPEMAAAKELIFLFQAPYYAKTTSPDSSFGVANGLLESFSQMNDPAGPNIAPVLINGVRRPTIVMQSGEVQRWRFINAQVFNFLNLSLDSHTFNQYTSDAYGSNSYTTPIFAPTYPTPTLPQGIILGAANRSSVTLKAGAPGTYYLRNLSTQQASRGSQPEDILATIIVQPSTVAMALPSAPFPVTNFLDPITDAQLAAGGGVQRNIVFRLVANVFPPTSSGGTTKTPLTTASGNAGTLLPNPSNSPPAVFDLSEWVYNTDATTMQNTAFTIGSAVQTTGIVTGVNGKPGQMTNPSTYYPFQATGAPTQTVPLNSTEEWTIWNMNNIFHPFHIHVNPMWVTKINGVAITPYWADTIALPSGSAEAPGSITFRMRFIDFTGPYVMHCHMLVHEDMGMMQAVTVV